MVSMGEIDTNRKEEEVSVNLRMGAGSMKIHREDAGDKYADRKTKGDKDSSCVGICICQRVLGRGLGFVVLLGGERTFSVRVLGVLVSVLLTS